MENILRYRKQFYEGCYDLRVLCEKGETAKSIAGKVVDALKRCQSGGYTSTRQLKLDNFHKSKQMFLDVVLEGLAPDGGLFVPVAKTPRLTAGKSKH